MSALATSSRVSSAALVVTVLLATTGALLGRSRASAFDPVQAETTKRLRLIQHAVQSYGNPAALIRAANLLRRGKADEVLLEVCIAMGSRNAYAAPELRDARYADHLQSAVLGPVRLFVEDADRRYWTGDSGQLLILATFSPNEDVLPPSRIIDQSRPCALMGTMSKTWPLTFIGGVPFDMTGAEAWAIPQPERGQCYGNSLVPRSFFDFVNWAHSHASLCQDPLGPPDAVFDLVDAWVSKFSESDSMQRLFGADGIAEVVRLVRGQVIRMTEGVLDSFVADVTVHPISLEFDGRFDFASLWPAYLKEARTRQLRWNRDSQAFELGG